jgi:hypothetical protein
MGSERAVARANRYRVAMLTGALALVLGGAVHGQDREGPPSGRGWIWGGGISGGWLGVPGGRGVALAVGEVTGGFILAGETFEVRAGEMVDAAAAAPADTTRLAPLPSSEASAGFSFHGGYAFSRRAAVLLHVQLVAGVESGFSTAMGGLMLRVWPTSRLWVEAGPASGDLSYGYEGGVVQEFATGHGVRTGAGVTVLQKPRWALDLEARFGTLSFDGVRATSVGVGLSASSRPR